jgi:hypothetical protein
MTFAPATVGVAAITVTVTVSARIKATLPVMLMTTQLPASSTTNTNPVFFVSFAQACFGTSGSVVPPTNFNSTTGHGIIVGPVQQQNVEADGACANVNPISPYPPAWNWMPRHLAAQ